LEKSFYVSLATWKKLEGIVSLATWKKQEGKDLAFIVFFSLLLSFLLLAPNSLHYIYFGKYCV